MKIDTFNAKTAEPERWVSETIHRVISWNHLKFRDGFAGPRKDKKKKKKERKKKVIKNSTGEPLKSYFSDSFIGKRTQLWI